MKIYVKSSNVESKNKYSFRYQLPPSYCDFDAISSSFEAFNDVEAVITAYIESYIIDIADVMESLERKYGSENIDGANVSDLSDKDIVKLAVSNFTLEDAFDLDPYGDDQANIIELKNLNTGKVIIKGEFMGPNGEDEDEYYSEEDW